MILLRYQLPAVNSVADPHHLDEDPDPDPASHFDADPNPDLTFRFDAHQVPDSCFQIKAQNLEVLK